MRWTWVCLALCFCASVGDSEELASSAKAGAEAIRALVEAYPAFLAVSEHAGMVRWKDGTEWEFDDHVKKRDFADLLNRPCLKDQLSIPYVAGWPPQTPGEDCDPGRIRYEPFFRKMYGETAEEVRKNLVNVSWLPGGKGKTVPFSKVNGAADALSRVAQEIGQLPPETRRYAARPVGTFFRRTIGGTERLSMHSFGAAIDLELPKTIMDSWEWHGETARAHPSYPKQALGNEKLGRIVVIFEKHGFIWGGKWYHFDTMHFEYRPELLTSTLPVS